MLYKHKKLANWYVEILDSTQEDVRYQDISNNSISILGKKYFFETFEPLVSVNAMSETFMNQKRLSLILFILGGSIVNALYSLMLFTNEQESAQLCLFNLFSCGVVTFLFSKAKRNSLPS